jgi:hypothetical protein
MVWRKSFESIVARERLDLQKAWTQTDRSDSAEGLYIKVEVGERTVGRYKFVRGDFVQAILDSDSHHAEQPFVPNILAEGVDIYAPALTHNWASLPDQWDIQEALTKVHKRIRDGQNSRR